MILDGVSRVSPTARQALAMGLVGPALDEEVRRGLRR